MARFPETEPEIAALAALVAEGLEKAAEDFPTPGVITSIQMRRAILGLSAP